MTVKSARKSRARKSTDQVGYWSTEVDGNRVVKDPALAAELLHNDEVIAIDTETTGLSPWRDSTAIVQLYGEQTGTAAIVRTPDGEWPAPIKQLMEGKRRTWVVHNGVGFDLHFMHMAGLKWRKKAVWYDTLVGESLIAPSGRRDVRKSLGASVKRRLGIEVNKDIEHGHWSSPELSDRQIEYAAQDVLYLPALYREQLEKAEKSNQAEAMAMEQELVPVVAMMSINGLPCRADRMHMYRVKQADSIKQAELQLKRWFGKDVNLNSTQQLQAGFKRHGIDVDSTAAEVLIEMAQFGGKAGRMAEVLLEYKHGAQRLKMYSEDWIANSITNDTIHPHFWQVGTDTTRFSCSDPNLQQIPKDGRADIIGGVPGLWVVNVDYSQLEVRIAANIAQDRDMLDIILGGGDIHSSVASKVFGIPVDKVPKDKRKMAKAMVFLLLFGGGATGFYKYVRRSGGELTEGEAAEYVHGFFSNFHGIRNMKERAEYLSRKDGPVFIRLPNSARRILVGYQKRSTTILNTMVQGSAAVGIKYAMLAADKAGISLNGQVHDELLTVVAGKERDAREAGMELKRVMEDGMTCILPAELVSANPSYGRDWQP